MYPYRSVDSAGIPSPAIVIGCRFLFPYKQIVYPTKIKLPDNVAFLIE